MFLKSQHTKNEKRAIAATLTFSLLALIAILCFGLYKITLSVGTLRVIENIAYVVMGLVIFIFVSLMIFAIYSKVYRLLFGEPKKSNHWIKNAGIKPTANRVNAQYSDNSIVWKVAPETLNWSTEISNPIVNYFEK